MSEVTPPEKTLSSLWAGLRTELRKEIASAAARGLETLKTPEPLTLYQWAQRHFYLSAESSQGEKRWESYPYQRGMLCVMGDDHIEEVTVRKSARVGYTKMLLAFMGYTAQHKRRNQCVWQPTDADSDEFCKAEVEPMLRDVKVMQRVFPTFMRKSKSNTLNMKKFIGSILFMKGGTSAGNYRRMTLQSACLDEFSAFDPKIEKSADPWTLAWKRLEGATYKKLIAGSTPRVKGMDHTERRESAAVASMRYYIECPHCGVEHPLVWGGQDVKHGFKWDPIDPEGTARHVCPHCHESITQAQYLHAWGQGAWVSICGNYRLYALQDGSYYWTDGVGCKLSMPPRHVAFHVWTAYSPQATWGTIVREWLHAVEQSKTGEKGSLEGFVNETLGETWEEEVEKTDSHELQKRAEAYPLRRIPVGGLDLVASVDVQDKWWAVKVLAVGRNEQSWVIDYVELDGNPGDERDWAGILYPYLQTTFYHWHGAPMRITGVGIDTGGHYTHQVYNFCRKHANEKYFALKGDSQEGKPIKGRASLQDVNDRGRIIKRGIKLWMVGTDTAKDLIYARLQIKETGPGCIHFSDALPSTYFKGLTSEVRRQQRTSTGVKSRWVKVTPRNEPLDCFVYCIFVSHVIGHHTYTERMWERLESALLPDLFISTDGAPMPIDMPAITQPAEPMPQGIALQTPTVLPTTPKPSNQFAPSGWMDRGFT